MNERQEKTSDILGKLTVLGTIVLPMNVVTGIWGMNCKFLASFSHFKGIDILT
jgi:magnesium transporter